MARADRLAEHAPEIRPECIGAALGGIVASGTFLEDVRAFGGVRARQVESDRLFRRRAAGVAFFLDAFHDITHFLRAFGMKISAAENREAQCGNAARQRPAGNRVSAIVHVAPTIIERVNRFFGYSAVARIAIRQGACAAPAPAPRVAPPSIRSVPIDLGDSLRTVSDPELRACLESLAGALAATTGAPILASGENDR